MKEIQATEYVSTNIVCKTLKIQPSTLRKYASLLDEKCEKEFFFTRDETNNRLYTNEDIATLQLLIDLKNKPGYTLEAATNEIVGFRYTSDTSNDIADNIKSNLFFNELHDYISQQNKYLEDYHKILQKKDTQIDRLEKLVESLIENNIDINKDKNSFIQKKNRAYMGEKTGQNEPETSTNNKNEEKLESKKKEAPKGFFSRLFKR